MKKYLTTSVVIVIIFISGFMYYWQSHISIWGFNISKNKLKDIIIDTKENQYMVTDSNFVLELSKKISKMKKLREVEPNSYPLTKNNPEKFTKIMVQDENNVTYGGSFWIDGNNIVLDSSGYYWIVTSDLIDLMDKSIKDAKRLH